MSKEEDFLERPKDMENKNVHKIGLKLHRKNKINYEENHEEKYEPDTRTYTWTIINSKQNFIILEETRINILRWWW